MKHLIVACTFIIASLVGEGALAKCFGDGKACEDVYVSKRDGCQVVVNDGRQLVKVSNARKDGRPSVGPITKVYGGSFEPILTWDGGCYKSGMYTNYIAEYVSENVQPQELSGIIEDAELAEHLVIGDSENANEVYFKVMNYPKVYLRIRLPGGYIYSPTFLKNEEKYTFPIGSYRSIEYCWHREKTPKNCTPYWTLRVGGTKTF